MRPVRQLELFAVHHHPDREWTVDAPLAAHLTQRQSGLDSSRARDQLAAGLEFTRVLAVHPDRDGVVGAVVTEHVDLVEQQCPALVVPGVRRLLGEELAGREMARSRLHRRLQEVAHQGLGIHVRARCRDVSGRLMPFERTQRLRTGVVRDRHTRRQQCRGSDHHRQDDPGPQGPRSLTHGAAPNPGCAASTAA